MVEGKFKLCATLIRLHPADQTRKKRGQQWTREEEVALWKLRRQGMEFDEIAVSVP